MPGRPILSRITGSTEPRCCNMLCCGMLPQIYGCLADVTPSVRILPGSSLPAGLRGSLLFFAGPLWSICHAVKIPHGRLHAHKHHRRHFGSRYKLGCCGHAGLCSSWVRYVPTNCSATPALLLRTSARFHRFCSRVRSQRTPYASTYWPINWLLVGMILAEGARGPGPIPGAALFTRGQSQGPGLAADHGSLAPTPLRGKKMSPHK